MEVMCWNIRSPNDPIKQMKVSNFIRNNHISINGIVEAKVEEKKMARITR